MADVAAGRCVRVPARRRPSPGCTSTTSPNIQSSWVTQGPKIGQLALFFGANDMGSLMIEENVVASAGTVYYLTLEQIKRAIREAGYVPRQRNVFYQYIDRRSRQRSAASREPRRSSDPSARRRFTAG